MAVLSVVSNAALIAFSTTAFADDLGRSALPAPWLFIILQVPPTTFQRRLPACPTDRRRRPPSLPPPLTAVPLLLSVCVLSGG